MPAPYISGLVYPSFPSAREGATAATVNADYLVPFTPRKAVTVGKIAFDRDQATAANVYVGMYDVSGNLLTNCAVDTDTTTGWHGVSTTPVDLSPDALYFLALNTSVDVIATHRVGFAEGLSPFVLERYGVLVPFASAAIGGGGLRKARTNAALPATQTMTGWTSDTQPVLLGIVPA